MRSLFISEYAQRLVGLSDVGNQPVLDLLQYQQIALTADFPNQLAKLAGPLSLLLVVCMGVQKTVFDH